MEKKAVIIPAAGSGIRMGSDIPKPFIKISGKTILQRSIECFLEIEGVVQIIIATSEEYFDECNKIFASIHASNISFQVIEGGTERQYSTQNALNEVNSKVELVAIHDAVRPFANTSQIRDCFKAANEIGGAILGVPAKDTIKKVNAENFIKKTPSRSELWQAQTPQIFKTYLIKEAYDSAIKNNFLGTDDASLVEQIGEKVKIVNGSRENFKITYPIDLKVAELIINKSI